MTPNEAIMYLAISFMIIIGIWLAALTYLVLKRQRVQTEQTKPGSDTIEDKIPEKGEMEEPTTDDEIDKDETSEDEKTEE